MLNIDLHSHSTCSDGQLTPQALVAAAAAGGVSHLALTDHDSIDGLSEARRAAVQYGVQLINGAEISVSWAGRTLHIVALRFDEADPALADLLAQLQQARTERAQAIGRALQARGLTAAYSQAEAMANGGQITRSHFARLLVEQGWVKDMAGAFKRYLRPGRPGHRQAQWADLEQAISVIQAAGGRAVLAHPLSYGMTAAWQRRMLNAFIQAGGGAMEVVCGSYNAEQLARCAHLAREYGLQGSAGSDFHAPEQRWLRLGRPLRLPADIEPVWFGWNLNA